MTIKLIMDYLIVIYNVLQPISGAVEHLHIAVGVLNYSIVINRIQRILKQLDTNNT